MERFWIELFLRGLFLWLLSALALLLLRRAAAAHRHLVCVLALMVFLPLPFLPNLLPPLRVLPPQMATIPGRATVSPQEIGRLSGLLRNTKTPATQDTPPEPFSGREASPLPPAGNVPGAYGASPLHRSSRWESTRRISLVLSVLWGLGTATLLIRLLVALFRLRRLAAESREAIVGNVPIGISEQVQTPLCWGIRRSIILLPAALVSGDRVVCETALRHEQAHIARWDWMWNLLAEFVCALNWFQPGVWWLRSRMRLESERACDDRVLLSGVAGPDYAAHLLEIVKSVGTSEIAPAMAHSGGMEERMRHILDVTRPRHTQTKWMAISATFALALLSLAVLRVSARTPNAKPQTDSDTTATASNRPPQEAAQGNAAPAATPNSSIGLEDVLWGKAVDGLEPGLLLTTPSIPKNHRVPFNSYVSYKVLVRNTTSQVREFEVQCWNMDDLEIPYFIPAGDIGKALDNNAILNKFRATGTDSRMDGVDPAYAVKLGPGETIVVPGEPGLYIGNAEKERFPQIAEIKMGTNWIVQPITIRPMTAQGRVLAKKLEQDQRDARSSRWEKHADTRVPGSRALRRQATSCKNTT